MMTAPFISDLGWVKSFDPHKRILTGRAYRVAKRLIDLSIVIISMPFWLPVLGLVALAIAVTSPGAPVIFVQQRTGKGGHRFSMFKFRSMVPNAEELRDKYAYLNEL